MKFSVHTPKNVEIKRTSCSEWEPLPNGTMVDSSLLYPGVFELVELDHNSIPAIQIYDVRDDILLSWRARIRRQDAMDTEAAVG